MLHCPDKKVLFIYGPTASGKTHFAYEIAKQLPIEIINMDSAQMYTPLTIGTAKADWRTSPVSEHLFDILDEPKQMTSHVYRRLAQQVMREVWDRGNIPVFVGGSGFYLASLLFPPHENSVEDAVLPEVEAIADADLWQHLKYIDTERAAAIHPNDYYRLRRALAIWYSTGVKPSFYKPTYDPIAQYVLVHITREREQLYARINERVHQMIEEGWLDEVQRLIGTAWESFVERKGFIGYAELIAFFKKQCSLEQAIAHIQQQTRRYAKRQETFWRTLQHKLQDVAQSGTVLQGSLAEFDLTFTEHHLYIRQLLDELLTCSEKKI